MSAPEVDVLRALLLAQAERLWSATLAAPSLMAQRREAEAPVVGDYVFVLHAGDTPPRKCIGVLRSIHLYSSASESPIDFTIQLFDGRTQHWENAQAVKLFTCLYDGAPSIMPDASDFEPGPYVCPGCHTVAGRCLPGCIDAEIEARREEEADTDPGEDDEEP
jgi:hypothetical protein